MAQAWFRRLAPEFWIALVLMLLNLAAIQYYVSNETLDTYTLGWTRRIAGGLVLAAGAGMFLRGSIGRMLTNLQLAFFSLVSVLAVCQSLIQLAPRIWPANIQNMIALEDAAKLRQRIIEYLPYSPYAKPLPNVRFTIPGFYGPASDFDYDFIADRRGFKNQRELDQRDQFDVVAVGDSFTEGLGVHARDTFVARLNARGISAYSLGIQGYAPTQFAGAFKRYGLALRPKVVVVGYLGNIYRRENFFLRNKKSLAEVESVPEAIGRLIERDRIANRVVFFETKEGYRVPLTIRQQYKFLPTALVTLASQYWYFVRKLDIRAGVENAAEDIRFGIPKNRKLHPDIKIAQLGIYRPYIMAAAERRLSTEELANDPAWKSTLSSFREIIGEARSVGAKVILLFFHDRSGVYYETATGKPLPPDYLEKSEATLLRAFADEENIDYLDTLEAFERQVSKLRPDSPYSDLPYLKIDGHPSPKGHELIAQLIQDRIEAKGYLRPSQPASGR